MGRKKNIIITGTKATKKGDTLKVDLNAKVIDAIDKVNVEVKLPDLVPDEDLEKYKTDEKNTYDFTGITDPDELLKVYESMKEEDRVVVADDKPNEEKKSEKAEEEKTEVEKTTEELTNVLTDVKDFEDKVEKEPEKAKEIIEEKIEKTEKAIEKAKKIMSSKPKYNFTNIWNGSTFDMDF